MATRRVNAEHTATELPPVPPSFVKFLTVGEYAWLSNKPPYNGKYVVSRRRKDRFGRLMKEQRKSGPDLKALKQWILEMRSEDERNLAPQAHETLQHWFDFLLVNEWPNRLADVTIGQKLGRWKNHIGPYLGHLPMAKIDKLRVREWLKELESKGVGLTTIAEARRDLQAMYTLAVDVYEILDRNPARRITRKRPPPRTKTLVTPEVAMAAIRSALAKRAKHDHQPREGEVPGWIIGMVATSFLAGLRKGEVQALSHEQIDRQRMVIKVTRAVRRERSGRIEIALPKCDKTREVPIPEVLLEVIDATTTSTAGLVWPTDARRGFRERPPVVGSPKSSCKVDHWFKQLRDTCGLPKLMVFRDTRSCYASWLNQLALGSKTVTQFLGHSRIETTNQYYVDVNDASVVDARKKIQGLVA